MSTNISTESSALSLTLIVSSSFAKATTVAVFGTAGVILSPGLLSLSSSFLSLPLASSTLEATVKLTVIVTEALGASGPSITQSIV